MSFVDEFDRALREVKNAEIRLNTMKVQLTTLDQEIYRLNNLEAKLSENLSYLKSKKIIALALEFKRVKKELEDTRSKLHAIRNDRISLYRGYKEIDRAFQRAKTALEEFKNVNNNVILGNFGRKNGGQRRNTKKD